MMAIPSASPMMLSQLLSGIITIPAENDCVVTGLAIDSREVQAGELFLACRGRTVDAAQFIDSATNHGAVAVLWEVPEDTTAMPVSMRKAENGKAVPVIAIKELSAKLGMIADRFYQSPSAQLFVTGITGTNGKTSCSQFLAQALSEDKPCGVIGTLGQGLYGNLQETLHTTADAVAVHRWMAEMLAQGAAAVAMEVSSHALDQGRVNGVKFDCAVFTNLSRDHLDYHGDMHHYAETKRSLFIVPELKYAIINSDDEFGRQLIDKLDPSLDILTYGIDATYQPKIHADKIKMAADGITFVVHTPAGQGELHTSLLGRFNVSNLLAVLGVLLIKGVGLDTALNRLQKITTVPGRMERFGGNGLPLVVVDYAHTPDALEQVLTALREHCEGELWCVFGCGGDRDKGKRPEMGEIAESLADKIVLTSDNPRSESSQQIIDDILHGIQHTTRITIQEDRHLAIVETLSKAKQNDVIVVAGKGHETYQQIGEIRYPFSDVQEVSDCLKGLEK